jgi:hypothetical protein
MTQIGAALRFIRKEQHRPTRTEGLLATGMTLHIAQQNGAITFPDETSIHPDMSQDAFRSDPAFAGAHPRNYGTLPWVHYTFTPGTLGGKPLLTSACFYDQLLIYVKATVSHYAPGANDWSAYSMRVESETKRYHDRLLAEMLGKPSSGDLAMSRLLPDGPDLLGYVLCWDYAWGRVSSLHDSRGGTTAMRVDYGDRLAWASEAYASNQR